MCCDGASSSTSNWRAQYVALFENSAVFSLTANDEKDMALYKKYRLFFP
jgi:hypothetical protein